MKNGQSIENHRLRKDKPPEFREFPEFQGVSPSKKRVCQNEKSFVKVIKEYKEREQGGGNPKTFYTWIGD